jgi:hypothetical protein
MVCVLREEVVWYPFTYEIRPANYLSRENFLTIGPIHAEKLALPTKPR